MNQPQQQKAAAEMQRLERMLLDPQEAAKVEAAWAAACQIPEGRVFGSGDGLAGVAYDIETGEYEAGEVGGDHDRAHNHLCRKADERLEDCDAADQVVVKGHAARILDFTLPVVMTRPKHVGDPSPPKADAQLLERGIALPIRLAYARTERYRKKLERKKKCTDA
jgi:hypothetical protein